MIQHWNPSDSSQWTLLGQNGPDAADFLNRLTTVDLPRLPDEAGSKGFFLDAQGRIQSAFILWKLSGNEFLFELDASPDGAGLERLIAQIDRYTFAERFELARLNDPASKARLSCAWMFPERDSDLPEALRGLPPMRTRAIEPGLRAGRQEDSDFGRPWYTVWAEPSRLGAWMRDALADSPSLDDETLREWRVNRLTPWWDAEYQDTQSPLELGLSASIADQKGCYPGQEAIERTRSIGSPPRKLVKLALRPGVALSPGDSLQNQAEPPQTIGTVTTVSNAPNRPLALALMRKIQAQAGTRVYKEGVEVGVVETVRDA